MDADDPMNDPRRAARAIRYRRRPDVVEAMQWVPSEPTMQDVLTWLREEGQVFKTVGRQVWIEWGEDSHKSWMVVHPGDFVVRKTEGRRYFYVESEKNFNEAREAENMAHFFADRLVEQWHGSELPQRSLASFMGLSDGEYALWLEGRYRALALSLQEREA